MAEELGRVLASRGYLVDRDSQRQGDFEAFTFDAYFSTFPSIRPDRPVKGRPFRYLL